MTALLKPIFLATCALLKLVNAEKGPRCPFPDPLNQAQSQPINVTFDPIFRLDLGSEVTSLIVDGASSIRYEINVNVNLRHVTFDFKLTHVSANATFTANGLIDTSPISENVIPRGKIVGHGHGYVDAKGVRFRGRATLSIDSTDEKVSFKTLHLEIVKFDSLSIHLGSDITIGGSAIDWDNFSSNIKDDFDHELQQHKTELAEKVRKAANEIIRKYTITEFLARIDELMLANGEDC